MRLLTILSSIKIGIVILVLIMVLVVIGTIHPLTPLTFQENVFQSLFVYWHPQNSNTRIPIYPGGYLLGGLLVINLSCSLFVHIKQFREKLGIYVIHLSLIFLILGETVSGIFSIEMILPVQIGQKATELPFCIELSDFKHVSHPDTNIPKSFSSFVNIYSHEGKWLRSAVISMNDPLRYQGLTFYQSGFGREGKESIFKVVKNPFRCSPYLFSGLVTFGLIYQFSRRLLKRNK